MESFNAILLKIVLVLVTAPAWYPFLKAVWKEFNSALADEGGVFGRPPSPKESEEIARELADREDPLINVPRLTLQERASGKRRFQEGGDEARSPHRGAARPSPRGAGRSRPKFR